MTASTADCVYKYVGVAVVVLFLLYLASRALTLHVSLFNRFFPGLSGSGSGSGMGIGSPAVLKEGFSDAETISATIRNFTSKIDDPLLVSKYRKTYEQVIIDLDDNMKTYLLASVINNAETLSGDPGSAENQRILASVVNVSAFRKTLNEAMGVLNNHA